MFMKRNHVLGVALLAMFAFGVLTASASAVTFLLATWLFNGAAVTTALLTEAPGELELVNTNAGGFGVTAKVLCSGIFEGWVGPESLDHTTEILTLTNILVSNTELVGQTAECTDTSGCENPKVWPDGIPGETEVELMVDGTEEFFVDLLFNAGWYVECTVFGGFKIAELCSAPETAVELKNEATGVDSTFSEAFQTLAGLKLAICGSHGEVGEVSGLGTTIDPEGTLAVSE
jgi:hypothetical protein